jgi:hypothetical protein
MWISGSAAVTGIVAAVIVAIVVWILNAISPATGFGWAIGVAVVCSFFAGYFGHIAGGRARRT